MGSNINSKSLHRAIINLAKEHRRRADIEFQKKGITHGQPKILSYLIQNDGCIQRELAENCHIEPATVTSILTSMEKQGFIYRKANDKDKRVYNVFLTERGIEAQQDVDCIFKLLDEECFKGFTDEEKLQIITLLNKMYENLK